MKFNEMTYTRPDIDALLAKCKERAAKAAAADSDEAIVAAYYEQSRAFAHAKQGWETFTKAALEYAVQQSVAPLAAVLWGKPAQKYAPVFAAVQDRRPVLVLESAHPSPLSAYRGFFGSAPFGKINAFLQQHGEAAIDWLK